MILSASRIVRQRGQNEFRCVPAGDGTVLLDRGIPALVGEIGYSFDDAPDRIIRGERSGKQPDPFHLPSDDWVFAGPGSSPLIDGYFLVG
jgi:hypothetical protein